MWPAGERLNTHFYERSDVGWCSVLFKQIGPLIIEAGEETSSACRAANRHRNKDCSEAFISRLSERRALWLRAPHSSQVAGAASHVQGAPASAGVPVRAPQGARRCRSTSSSGSGSICTQLLRRGAALLRAIRRPTASTTQPRGTGPGGGPSPSRAVCPHLFQLPVCVDGDHRGPRPLRPQWAAASVGPLPPAQAPANNLCSGEGRRDPQQPSRSPPLSLRSRAAQPERGTQVSSLSYSLYRGFSTPDRGFSAVTEAASGAAAILVTGPGGPRSDPDLISLRSSAPWVPQWTRNIPGRQAVV
ncbi:hypothetical protein NDU88_003755 [Pleurodeles waltl]|uniref:Uncharacterized protein n=1 Tax=Pleurodeles waltl TaxID=8319 RepID=A0AAV7RG49_PLEWA|nr:hypothetical protein NDU88_003755 [Pleurodeles waltl]